MSFEDKQKAITEIEGQVKEIEERKCETPEAVEERNAELAAATSKFEGAINELKEARRLEEGRPSSQKGGQTRKVGPQTHCQTAEKEQRAIGRH
mgnify:CR=1 FL=1